ncbi:hypothetical protein TTHERM_00607100 (macronuclear) [Tetrahymena thermophila SB210]|uniref:Uncharacterized protein n=1 Tax=Tetrahymena thermophila (strain SB210) TaxID=312017 RepID=Q22YI1_TETTS|nr:hypothetical protein TTHERM_00607100 [Tetrahymena thermophila SB210]EAR90304.1 hypothetical protein TTHERM_00607100 [Tetrahymena thermophila SB210]|eukprot:XP_001010549.1 hypothetical protein TTHERM_00607100 [Tetrahymena thermophila SB210]
MISEREKIGQIIKRNVNYLAFLYKKGNERNLLNKWFQDSIKNYILEQIASPLISKYLNFNTSAKVKDLILKNADKSKPKYMGIIEQYFFYINKYKQGDRFIQKLNAVICSPIDYSTRQFVQTYNNEKNIRKQFVCYLILRYFESQNKCQFPSFYELWNFCFPEDIQTKKKLTRFDNYVEMKKSKGTIKKNTTNCNSFYSSDSLLNSSNTSLFANKALCFNNQSPSNYNFQTNIQSLQFANIYSKQHELKYEEDSYYIQNIQHYPIKQEINNHIFEDNHEELDKEEPHDIFQQLPSYQKNETKNNYFQNQFQQQNKNDSLYYQPLQQDQNQFQFQNQQSYLPIYQTQYYQEFTQPLQNNIKYQLFYQ